uniref:Calx-beta domain-containing protein n=1 Tax=Romanomermis culicivorax TaxID=13658 RepID=A0A915L9J6_ROMCU
MYQACQVTTTTVIDHYFRSSNLFIQRPELKLELVEPHMATIMILDDDHAGVFSFENKSYSVSESAGHIEVRVLRTSGARGKVLVPYKTVEGTATAVKDFEPKNSYLEFDNEETEKTVIIGIVNDEEYEKTETFYIQLEEPIWIEKMSDPSKIVEKYKKRQQRKLSNRTTDSVDSSLRTEDLNFGDKTEVEMLGKPHLGQYQKCAVKIIESTEFKGFIDQLMKKANLSLIVGTSSWREQFSEALSVNSSEDPGDEKQENPPPRLVDYVGHYVTLPWKLVGACCPPTSYYGGKLCFVASIILIGVFTAIIGDLANYFGCTIGLKDAVTAISFVAMGTSVPDLFASKVAAVQDKYADSSIGNVTGSNAVNVFLGIGVAWTLCAVAAALRNDPNGFQVDPGSLAFSVTIFCTDLKSSAIVADKNPKIFSPLNWGKNRENGSRKSRDSQQQSCGIGDCRRQKFDDFFSSELVKSKTVADEIPSNQ